MGMPYALLKVAKPEAFDLGKGSRMGAGWMEVFERRLGHPFGIMDSKREGNFLEPIHNLDRDNLIKRLTDFDNGYTGPADQVADGILNWMGDDVCILCNGWEELEMMIEDHLAAGEHIQQEFADTAAIVTPKLIEYKQTGSVWG